MTEIQEAENRGYDQAMADALVAIDRVKHMPIGCKAQVCNYIVLRDTLKAVRSDRICQE